jgi:hypothetical protein
LLAVPPYTCAGFSMADSGDDDRLFVRDGWRHYRRRYSLIEVRWGIFTFACILAITAWLMWRGRHPDPHLLGDATAVLETAPAAPLPLPATPAAPVAEPAAAPADRGPLPRDLAGPGWKEDKVAQFDEENLYVKIDGRADYFRAFNFRRLYSVLLTSEKDPATTVDVEIYDLGTGPNALGAYSGERPPEAKVEVSDAGLLHFDRNALYLARGPYYIRVIGSDETPVVTQKLRQLADVLIKNVSGEPLPWAYGLLIGQMNIGADKITYSAKNAFSLAFADDVWAARPRGKQTDLELFVSARPAAPAARTFADQLRKSFLELGQRAGKTGGVELVKDQFLGLFAGVTTQDRFVLGVRGAASKDEAVAEVARLRKALSGAPAELLARAVASPASPAAAKTSGAPASDAPESPAKPVQRSESADER